MHLSVSFTVTFQLVKNRTAIMITHRYDSLAMLTRAFFSANSVIAYVHSMTSVRYCDNVAVILDGACVENGPPSELLQQPDR